MVLREMTWSIQTLEVEGSGVVEMGRNTQSVVASGIE